MGIKRKIQDWIETKFLFVIRKEDDFSVITSMSITKIRVLLLLILGFLLAFGFSLLMSRTLLRAWFDPEYLESENTAKIMVLTEVVDSLMTEVIQRDNYVKNIQGILSGDSEEIADPKEMDSSLEISQSRLNVELFQESDATRSIMDEFRTSPLDFSDPKTMTPSLFSETYFFPPLKGVVIAGFEPQINHFGVDVVAKENEPVKVIAAGTVIFASWTLETGYVIGIQHSNELISIYKHNSVILKDVGDAVRGGEIISIIGNTGELSSGQHLHFELWYKGNPLNPQEFITFD